MQLWILFALGAALSWGLYGPALHGGQVALGNNPMRALLCVGCRLLSDWCAGALVSPCLRRAKLNGFTTKGTIGAISGGAVRRSGRHLHHIRVQIRRRADLRNAARLRGSATREVLYSMWLHPPKTSPNPLLYLGFVLAAGGGALVLYFKPSS
jgi:hypothetical protein